MNLTAKDVAEIMRAIEGSSFDELDLEMDGVKLSLRRTGAGAVRETTAAPPAQAPPPAPVPPPAKAQQSAPADVHLRDITSPLLGTFYRAPKPGSAPFVEIGSQVEEDTVIAIIEVMKLMNTVRAGVRGVIGEILPADESLVEFGDVLMRVCRDG